MTKVALSLAKGKSFFCNGIFAIGAYIDNDIALLIDSGSDEKSAKDACEAVQVPVGAIINTHCHPDHCGGNYFFQKKFPELKVYAAHSEKDFIEDPSVAPRCFCGGAAPFAGLQNKHIAPQKQSVITNTLTPYADQVVTIHGQDFSIITLPGHTPGSIGIITPDNVLYSGDALFGQETVAKHYILFYTDIGRTLESFKKLAALKVDACVLYHGGLIHDLANVVREHETRILETKDSILAMLKMKTLSIDSITQQIMQMHKIPDSLVSFTLTQTTMRAYLTQLEHERMIELKVTDGLLQARAM